MHWTAQVSAWFGYHVLSNRLSHMAMLKCSPPYRSLSAAVQEGTASRIVSSVHASVATVVAFWTLFAESLAEDPLTATSAYIPSVVTFSMGYMVADLLNEARCWLRGVDYQIDPLTIVHHALVICTGWLYHTSAQQTYTYVIAMGMATEVSTPLLNARWLGLHLGWGDIAVLVWSLLMLAGFAFVRVPLSFAALYTGLTHRDVIWERLAGGECAALTLMTFITVGGITVLNSYWFSLILKGAYDTMRGASVKDD